MNKAKRIFSIVKSNIIFPLAFILPVIIIVAVFTYIDIGYFGDKTIVFSDMRSQYIAFFGKLKDVLSGDGSLLYSFNKSLGGNTIGLFAYYLASPLNLILIFFPKKYIGEAVLTIYLIKIGLSSLNISIYLNKVYKKKDISTLIFSLCYSLMAYNISFHINVMWLDGVLLLPLIALAMEKIIDENKYKLYIFLLFLAIISNYYIGYMICIFAGLYFIYKSILKRKLTIKNTLVFLKNSLISVGFSAFLLVPVLMSLRTGKASFNLFKKPYITESFVNGLSKLFIGSYNINQVQVTPANIYCGVIITILLILYFFNKNIKLKEKMLSLVLLIIVSLSFHISTFTLLWHGFNFPVGFHYRNSFIFSFLMIILSYKSWINIKAVKYRYVFITMVLAFVATVFVYFGAYDYLDNIKIIATFSMVIIYMILFFLFRLLKKGKKIIRFICLIAVISELTANGYLTFLNNSYTDKKALGQYIEEVEPIIEEVRNLNNDNFYRVEQSYKNTTNDGMLLNYNGLTHSSSANDLYLRDVLKELGYKTSLVYEIYNMGSTIPIDSLLGIKYIIAINNSSTFNSYIYPQNMYFNKPCTEGDYSIYENPYALPIAYMVNEKLKNTRTGEKTDTFSYSNSILNNMINEEFDLYNKLEITDVKFNNIYTETINNETVYRKINNNQRGTVEFTVKAVDNNPVFIFLKSQAYEDYINGKGNRLIGKNGVLLNVNNSIKFEQFTSKAYNVQFIGNYLKDNEFKIVMTVMNSSTTIEEVQIYSCDMSKFKEVYDELSLNTIENTEYKDGYVKGNINVNDDKKLMFTSIPYDEGWTLKVDGKKHDYIKVLNGFIAVELDEGQHKIQFKYVPPGLKIGILISFLTLGFLILKSKKCRQLRKNEK